MNNFENLEIQQQKLFANSNKYFELFDKYLNGSYKNCLLYMIGNVQTIAKLMRKNNSATYYVYDNGLVIDCLKNGMPDYKNFRIMLADERKISNDKLWEGMKRMKFDRIIMNPPYSKNLHLKVLEEAIKHLTDEGKCVNLSPIRWLQDPLAKYKRHTDYHRFEESVSKHIENIEIIDTQDANKMFNILLLQPLAVYFLSNKLTNFNYMNVFNYPNFIDRVFNKICEDKNYEKQNKVKFTDDLKNFVIINKMAPPMKYGKPMFDAIKTWCGYFVDGVNLKGETYREAKKNCSSSVIGNIENDECIVFETKEETINCYNAMQTNFVKYFVSTLVVDVHVHQEHIPWMVDYTHPWTDEDFYKFFEITEEEQKIIEETMAKYK